MPDSNVPATRSLGQIRHKLKQVIYRHLQKELRDAFRVLPEGCFHNQPQNLKGLGPVFLCQLPRPEDGKPRKTLCDSRMWNGIDQAKACPHWQPKRDKDAIKAEFRALVTSNDRGLIAARFPDVAALMWVIDGAEGPLSWDEVESVQEETPAEGSTP